MEKEKERECARKRAERGPVVTRLMPLSRQTISDSRTTNSNGYSSAASPATSNMHYLRKEAFQMNQGDVKRDVMGAHGW